MRKENREKNIGWRLDYVNISRIWVDLIEKEIIECGIRNDVMGSDHCPVEMVVSKL